MKKIKVSFGLFVLIGSLCVECYAMQQPNKRPVPAPLNISPEMLKGGEIVLDSGFCYEPMFAMLSAEVRAQAVPTPCTDKAQGRRSVEQPTPSGLFDLEIVEDYDSQEAPPAKKRAGVPSMPVTPSAAHAFICLYVDAAQKVCKRCFASAVRCAAHMAKIHKVGETGEKVPHAVVCADGSYCSVCYKVYPEKERCERHIARSKDEAHTEVSASR